MPDQPLTTAQVARQLGLSQQQVIRLARAGVLKHERTPLGRLYDPKGVEKVRVEREAARSTRSGSAVSRGGSKPGGRGYG